MCSCIVDDAANDSVLATYTEINADSAGPESSEACVGSLKGYRLLKYFS